MHRFLLVSTFRTLSTLTSPVDKLHCVVRVAKAICACVDEAKQAQAKAQRKAGEGEIQVAPVVIGADDLLLLFTYLLLHSGVPSLWCEFSYLSDFIPDHQRCTMFGYYLATFTAAAELLMSEQFHETMRQREGQGGANGQMSKAITSESYMPSASSTAVNEVPTLKTDSQQVLRVEEPPSDPTTPQPAAITQAE